MLPSSRFPASFEPNPLTRAVRQSREAGRRLIDLTLTNPTRAGFSYPHDLLTPLASPDALRYHPEPFGLRAAREAVAGDYLRRGVSVDPARIVLTASTSEAYAWLFKSCCRPTGDAVLIPAPSYPLLDHLTALEGVRPLSYRLEYQKRWSIDTGTLDDAWTEETRAVLAVSPNNPTGSAIGAAEISALGERCARRGALLIVDEVFADYPLGPPLDPVEMPGGCLVVRLGGLSKSAGLPQVKLGWMAVTGPEPIVRRVMERLELIADTYLSVSTPVQLAAGSLIAAGAHVRAEISERVRSNHDALRQAAARYPAVEVLAADAGWSAVVRVPSTRTEEELAIALLHEDGVLVHPGFLFDFASGCHLVVSLLPDQATFAEGVRLILERVDGR
jgi:aspartate/methionine/tyrosine aminotransferase